MSSTLGACQTSTAPPSDHEQFDAAFDANRDWELDRSLMLARSERRAWLLAATAVVVAVLSVVAVAAHGPLQRVIEVPIVVDRQTGETTIQQRLSAETVPAIEALDKHHAAVFVRAREGYSWWWLQRDFDQVARTAVPAVFADYNRLFEGDAGLQKKLGSTEEWRINVINVRLSPNGRKGKRGEATVTYEKVVRFAQHRLPDSTSRHVASLVYEYQPKVLAKERDRLENPLGFVVIAYRSDPEISTAPSVASANP